MFDIADAKSVIAHITDSAVAVYTCPPSRKAQITEFIVTNMDEVSEGLFSGYCYIAAQDESSSGGEDSVGYFANQVSVPASGGYTPFGESPSKWLSPGDTIYLLMESEESSTAFGSADLDMSVIEYSLPE